MSPQAAISNTVTKSRMVTGLVHRRRNDDAKPDGHGAHEDGESGIVLLNHLFPQVVRRQLVHDHESDGEHHDADEGEHQRIHDVGYEVRGHVHLTSLPRSGDSRCRWTGTIRDCRAPTWARSSPGSRKAAS